MTACKSFTGCYLKCSTHEMKLLFCAIALVSAGSSYGPYIYKSRGIMQNWYCSPSTAHTMPCRLNNMISNMTRHKTCAKPDIVRASVENLMSSVSPTVSKEFKRFTPNFVRVLRTSWQSLRFVLTRIYD